MQFPDDAHGSAALVTDIIRSSKEGIWGGAAGILLILAHKQKHLAAILPMVDISLTGWGLGARGALTLPMEQAGSDLGSISLSNMCLVFSYSDRPFPLTSAHVCFLPKGRPKADNKVHKSTIIGCFPVASEKGNVRLCPV